MFGTTRIGQIDRLVFLPQVGELAPFFRVGIDDRRLVIERNSSHIHEVQRIHKSTLDVAAHASVFGVVVQNSGHQRRSPSDHASRHRHALIGVDARRGLHDFLCHHSLCLRERGGGVLIANPNPLFDQHVVAFCELLDAVFLALQFTIQSLAFAANGPTPFGGQIPLCFLAGTHDRLPHADLDLAAEPVSHRGIQVV